LEHPHRSALENHVHRTPRLGNHGLLNVRIGIIVSYKTLRSFWRRWHPLEVGNILWRLVPRSPALRVDNSLRRKPIVLVETTHRYAHHTGPR
jgi:hypothetical protein